MLGMNTIMVKVTRKGDFSLLAHIATQVQHIDLEIRHNINFMAIRVKLSTKQLLNRSPCLQPLNTTINSKPTTV